MGQCEYADGFLDGYHCKNHYNDKVPSEMVKYYCTMHTQCSHCPWHGGNDGPRQKDLENARWKADKESELAAKEAQKQKEEADRRARALREQAGDEEIDYHYSGGSGGGGGGSSSSGDIISALFSTSGLCILLTVGVLALCVLGHWLGWTGPWVQMQVPASAATKSVRLYSVCRDSAHYFEVRSENFDETGNCKLRTHLYSSEIYLEQNKASVWMGLCDLRFLNTGVVYDYTYEEAADLMLRPLLIQLQDAKKTPLEGLSIQISDARGNELSYTELGNALYAVLLPNDTPDQLLTLYAAGYLERHIPFKGNARLSKVVVTLE